MKREVTSYPTVINMSLVFTMHAYSHRYVIVVYHTLAYYSVKFGGAGATMVSNELQQLHTKGTFASVDAKSLSRE